MFQEVLACLREYWSVVNASKDKDLERIYNDDLRKLKERRGANKLISNIDKIICIVFTTTHKERIQKTFKTGRK